MSGPFDLTGHVALVTGGEPGDFARLAVYLAGGIGGFHTGDEIVVDGAYSIF